MQNTFVYCGKPLKVLKSKSGRCRIDVFGSDTIHKLFYYDCGKLLITFTYYDCSIEESLKKFFDAGWYEV